MESRGIHQFIGGTTGKGRMCRPNPHYYLYHVAYKEESFKIKSIFNAENMRAIIHAILSFEVNLTAKQLSFVLCDSTDALPADGNDESTCIDIKHIDVHNDVLTYNIDYATHPGIVFFDFDRMKWIEDSLKKLKEHVKFRT